MKKTYLAVAVAAAMLPALASADGLNYSYVDAGIGMIDADNQTLIGPDLRGSFAATEDIFIYGGLRVLSDDVDYTNWHIGAGYRFGLNDVTDMWVGANLEYQEYDPGGDDTAPAIRGGVRHQLNNEVELGASVRVVTGDGDYVGFGGYGRYKMSDNLSLKGELDVQDGDLGLIAGVTFFF